MLQEEEGYVTFSICWTARLETAVSQTYSFHRWVLLRCLRTAPPWSSNSLGRALHCRGHQGVLRHFRCERHWPVRMQLPQTMCACPTKRPMATVKVERNSGYFTSLFITTTRANKPRPVRISTVRGVPSTAEDCIVCWNILNSATDASSLRMLWVC